MIKILIAEDEQIEREFIANIVKTSQPEILLLQAENGEEALRLYQEHQPEIVFLDICRYTAAWRCCSGSAPFPGRPARCSS